MTKTKQELQAELDYLDDCLRSIGTEFEGRALDTDTQVRFDEGVALRKQIRETIKGIEAREAELRQIALSPANRVAGDDRSAPAAVVRQDPHDLNEVRTAIQTGQVRDAALSALEKVRGLSSAQQDRIASLVDAPAQRGSVAHEVGSRVLLTGSEAYRTAFSKYLAYGDTDAFSPEERAAWTEARAVSHAGTAGYAVPFTLDPTIILTSDGSANPFRQISRVVNVTTDAWHGVSTAGITAGFAAEYAEATDNAPTLAQPTVNVHKAHAWVPFSIEAGQDWPGMESDIRALLVDAKDTLEATKFAVGAGDGSNEPVGIVTALTGTSSEINVAGSETFAAVDVYAMEAALGPRFRPNASFVANKAIYHLIRQFDTGGGAQLWERIGAAQPAELLGYPAYEASAMDGTYNAAATANNYIAVLGDFRNYVIADRIGLQVELVPHTFATNANRPDGGRGLYAYWRVGADSVNDAAFTMLDLPTAA